MNESGEWIDTVSPAFMRRWVDFVDPPRRLATEAPFLARLLVKPGMCVFDAAMGMGLEARFFAENGCRVIANEISDGFRQLAGRYMRDSGVVVEITEANWLALDSALGDLQFDVVLLLGNSFSLLRDAETRRGVAENLRRVCKKGGRLVLDQRNFDYILANRGEILSGNYRYSGRVIYCGSSVIGVPIDVCDHGVRFAYGMPGFDPLGVLDMHPLRLGEIETLFREVGFTRISVASDFEDDVRTDADFYTYTMS